MNLRETIIACDHLREISEGIGLSDGLMEIIEFAYTQGQNSQKEKFESVGNIAFSIRHEKEDEITDAEWIEALRRCIDNLTPDGELNIERIRERTDGQFEDTIKL